MKSTGLKAVTVAMIIACIYIFTVLLVIAYSDMEFPQETQGTSQQSTVSQISVAALSSGATFTFGTEESDDDEEDEEELSSYDQQVLEGSEDTVDDYEEELNDLEDDVDDIEDDIDDADDESDLDDAADDLDDAEGDVEYLITKISKRINLLEDIDSDDAEDLQNEFEMLKDQAEDLLNDIDDVEDDIEDEEDDMDEEV